MMDYLETYILFLIAKKVGANKQFYLPFRAIYNIVQDQYDEEDTTEEEISDALDELTDAGYLESSSRGYRITTNGYIYIEAYRISHEMSGEIRQELKQELKEEIEKELKTRIDYQWLFIMVASIALAILIVVLQR